MEPDPELLCRYLKDGSEAAFTEIVQRHLPLVYGAAMRQLGGDAHEARDVAQLVFTDLARKAQSLQRRSELASWLYTSTRFAAAKVRRARSRRQKYEGSPEVMSSLHDESPPSPDWERLAPLLDDALHELRERDRRVILLRYFSNRRYAEIGSFVGISTDAARLRVDRALEKLRHVLLRRGITSTSAALALLLTTHISPAVPGGMAASVVQAALVDAAAGSGAATRYQFWSPTKLTVGFLAVVVIVVVATWRGANRPPFGVFAQQAIAADLEPADVADLANAGQRLYGQTCVACHQLHGLGVTEVFPPLANSPTVVGDAERLIRIVAYGVQKSTNVRQNVFNNSMPAFHGPNSAYRYSEREIAAVLTYIRSAWGNVAAPVSEETVRTVLAAIGERTTPGTLNELGEN